MSQPPESIPEIHPFAVESWANQDLNPNVEIDRFRDIAFSGALRYVAQRAIFPFDPSIGPAVVGSDSFSFCSALLLRDRVQGTCTFSHLMPFGDELHAYLRSGYENQVTWTSPHDAVLVYGSMSKRQYELEGMLQRGFWGPASLHTIHLETGRTPWGLAFSTRLGQLAVVRSQPDQSVFRYQLFDPTPK